MLTPEILLIPEFTQIRQQLKDKASDLFLFIYYMCDLDDDNPIRDMQSDEKFKSALKYAYGSKKAAFTKKEYALLKPAIEAYLKYNRTAEERILITFDEKVDELITSLDDTEPEAITYYAKSGVKFATNSGIINAALEEIAKIKEMKKRIMSAIINQSISTKIRGKLELSPLSRGMINLDFVNDIL